MKKNRMQRLEEARITHRANIQRNLEHRLDVAKAKGDESLIHQLEAEANYYNY